MALHLGARPPKLAVIADDDEGCRALLASWLSELGFVVHASRDGVELVDRLDGLERDGLLRRPFLVVTDVDMPRQNGLDAVGVIRRRFALARVVLMSGLGDPLVKLRGLALGAAALIQKPFSRSRLTKAIEQALGTASARTRIIGGAW